MFEIGFASPRLVAIPRLKSHTHGPKVSILKFITLWELFSVL